MELRKNKTKLIDPVKIEAALVPLEKRALAVKEQVASGSWWRWLLAVLGAALVALGIALVWRKIKARGEELARLRTQVEQDKLKAEAVKHALEVGTHRENLADLESKYAAIKLKINLMETFLAKEEANHLESIARVQNIQGWAALDAYNKENR